MTRLDFSSLENAVAQLRKSFDYFHSDLALRDSELREQFRAATIQAFEFTYELAIKMIHRQLEIITANPSNLRHLAFADLMRTASESGLITDPISYVQYRDLRNKSSHTYDANWAEKIVASVDEFLRDMDFLLAALRKNNHEPD